MSRLDSEPQASDAELIERARSGDRSAFGELWRRHYRPAARVARQFTSSIDADDLVSEAYARIYQRVLAGGGPTGAFRPYLYTTIRNIASTWGAAASRDVHVDLIDEFEDERIPDDPAAWALDRTLTARAFRSLPERWQTVLWYTEVEGMDPHEVAPLMGLTANGVAALSYRAREGLRRAWLQAHVNDATASGECQWAMSRLGDHSRNGLSNRDRERLTAHLAECSKCTIVSEELEEVSSHLAMVLIPLLLGAGAGSALLASMAEPSGAMAAELDVPDLPSSVDAVAGAGAVAAPAVTAGLALGSASGTGMVVGGFALAGVVAGSIALGAAGSMGDDSQAVAEPAPIVAVQETTGPVGDPLLPPEDHPADQPAGAPAAPGEPGTLADVLGGDVEAVGDVLEETVQGVIDTITDDDGQIVSATVQLHLTGTATPGATIKAQAAGQVYATVVADASGHFVIDIAALPAGLSSLELVQVVDRTFLKGLVLGDNPLAELLGLLDALIAKLTKPLGLSSSSGGVQIILAN